MAKGKKTGGRDFKKGEVTNPKGRKPLPPDVREAINMIREDIIRTVYDIREMRVSEASKLDNMTLGRRAIVNAYLKMDYQGIKIYEDRVLGKAKETNEIITPDGFNIVFTNKTAKQD